MLRSPQLIVLPGSNFAQHTAHYLARACLGQARGPVNDIWCSKGADLGPHSSDKIFPHSLTASLAIVQRYICVDTLPLDWVLNPVPRENSFNSDIRRSAFCSTALL